jgi:hypothetical protein
MISEHFTKRCKERCGIHKCNIDKYFDKILDEGLTLNDCLARPSFYTYLRHMCKSVREPIVYNRYIIDSKSDWMS